MASRFVRASLAALLLATPLACGGSSSGSATPDQIATRDKAAVNKVLESGSWKLTSWRPDSQLEAMLQELLNQQFATMTVRFQGGHILADSPSIHVDRVYQVTDAAGPQFTVVATDQNGVQLTTAAQLSEDGNTIDFRGQTDPWRGYGQLRKITQ